MNKIKVLNLYAGIGGNRKLWENVEVTAIENNKIIAGIYKKFFPGDKVIITDAHKYLLEHYNEFDFIWSSPPCQTHSRIRKIALPRERIKPAYPDMRLYQEIIFLQHHAKIPYVVENVKGYYTPLITPQEIGRHYFWSNFIIPKITLQTDNIETSNIKILEKGRGFNLDFVKGLGKRKDTALKNCVNPELGKHILEFAFFKRQTKLFERG
jgi:DNA (cytosine-5)-methyltransferase 1